MTPTPAPSRTAFPQIHLGSLSVASVSQAELVEHILRELAEKRGGWLVTANLDILLRSSRDPLAREAYEDADIVVADGMPLVWAARVQGQPLPERIAGSTLVGDFADACGRQELGLLLLGGAPGTAEAAAESLRGRCPGLRVHGDSSPRCSSMPTDAEVDEVAALCERARCDIVLIGLGSPKQEYLIRRLRSRFPHTWFVGVGVSFSFASGQLRRAPALMQKVGLEWVHRLAQEPKHLAKRYLVDDVPFFGRLMFGAARARFARRIQGEA